MYGNTRLVKCIFCVCSVYNLALKQFLYIHVTVLLFKSICSKQIATCLPSLPTDGCNFPFLFQSWFLFLQCTSGKKAPFFYLGNRRCSLNQKATAFVHRVLQMYGAQSWSRFAWVHLKQWGLHFPIRNVVPSPSPPFLFGSSVLPIFFPL